MTRPDAVLLFAAGLGTRMAPLTDTRPKPLIEVAGRPLLDHALDYCTGLNVVLNTHYMAEQIRSHIAGREIQISSEADQLLETGGGLKKARGLLGDGPVFTMNTDAVWDGPSPIETLRQAWRPTDMDGLLLMIPRAKAVGHRGSGDFDIDESGRIQRGSEYVYSGVQIIRTTGLDLIHDDVFSMWALWDQMLDQRSLYGVPYTGAWCDVGQPDSIALAEAMLESGQHV